MAEDPDWQRLGAFLRYRRIELCDGVDNRTRFFQDRGIDPTGGPARTLSDMETGNLGSRKKFEAGSLSLAEFHYKWKPESAARVLRGGEPMPNDEPDVSDERPTWKKELFALLDRVTEKDSARVRDYLLGVVEQT